MVAHFAAFTHVATRLFYFGLESLGPGKKLLGMALQIRGVDAQDLCTTPCEHSMSGVCSEGSDAGLFPSSIRFD